MLMWSNVLLSHVPFKKRHEGKDVQLGRACKDQNGKVS